VLERRPSTRGRSGSAAPWASPPDTGTRGRRRRSY
jgi:hypothetical protein